MIRLGLVFLVMLLQSTVILGQSTRFTKLSKNQNYRIGRIEKLHGEPEVGLIRMRSELTMHRQVTFIDSAGTKSTYQASELKGYEMENDKYHSDGKAHFYKLMDRGHRISLYQRRFKPTQKTDYGVERDFANSNYKLVEGKSYEDLGVFLFFRKSSDQSFFKIPQEGGFNETLATYFEDCPKLAADLRLKKFEENALSEIMNAYNFQCEF